MNTVIFSWQLPCVVYPLQMHSVRYRGRDYGVGTHIDYLFGFAKVLFEDLCAQLLDENPQKHKEIVLSFPCFKLHYGLCHPLLMIVQDYHPRVTRETPQS